MLIRAVRQVGQPRRDHRTLTFGQMPAVQIQTDDQRVQISVIGNFYESRLDPSRLAGAVAVPAIDNGLAHDVYRFA